VPISVPLRFFQKQLREGLGVPKSALKMLT